MKKFMFVVAIISLFLIAACAQQPADQDSVVGQGTPVNPSADNQGSANEIDSGTSMAVPAPGNEDVEEMIVVGDSEANEPITLPPEEGSLVHDVEPEAVEISMTAKQWEFDPGIVTVREGSKVKLNIKSIDVTHGFALPDFGVSQRLEPGKTVTVEFTADKKGTYTFFCNVACGTGHKSMKGTLVVE